MTVTSATAENETPVFFPADEYSLLGVHTTPSDWRTGMSVVVLPGGGNSMVSHNRVFVRMCRIAAGVGYHALRFDYHGVGGSTGTVERLRLDEPFSGDVRGALRWLEGKGISSFVLAGSCSGSRTALACAAELPSVKRLVMISGPLGDTEMGEMTSGAAAKLSTWQFVRRGVRPRVIKGAFRADRRRIYVRALKAKLSQALARLRGRERAPTDEVSSTFLRQLTRVVERRIPVLLVYGTEDENYKQFQRNLDGELGGILSKGEGFVQTRVLEGQVHAFPRVDIQEAVLDSVIDWLSSRSPETGVEEAARSGHGLRVD